MWSVCQCFNVSVIYCDRDARSAGEGDGSAGEDLAERSRPVDRTSSPGIRRGSWGTQDGTAGRRSCLNAVFRALYVAEENYEVRTRKTHTGLGLNAIFQIRKWQTREVSCVS